MQRDFIISYYEGMQYKEHDASSRDSNVKFKIWRLTGLKRHIKIVLNIIKVETLNLILTMSLILII